MACIFSFLINTILKLAISAKAQNVKVRGLFLYIFIAYSLPALVAN